MTKIAFIPIDNRPVCYDLPLMIVKQAKEHEILMPNINMLGDLTKVADYNGLLNWLASLNNTDVFVISLDTVAYGGLIPSRRSNDSFEEIKTAGLQLTDEQLMFIFRYSQAGNEAAENFRS